MAECLILDNCHLDLGGHALRRDGRVFAIEPTDYRVLLHLVGNAPDCVSTQRLLQKNWASTVVSDNSLHQVIHRLRVALGDNARSPRFIQTLSRVGYRFIAHIEDATDPTNSQTWRPNPILVMPFQNYSLDKTNPFIVDGLLIELSQQLAKAGIDVISREITARFGTNHTPDLPSAETLDARYVLTGAIAQQHKRLRVNVSLSDVTTKRLLWSETYDCDQASLFDAHSQLSVQISDSILEQLKHDPMTLGRMIKPQHKTTSLHNTPIVKDQNTTAWR